MSIQREIMRRLLGELPLRFPGCGILLAGSVQRGSERPDSDIDLFVVYDGDGPLGRQPEKSPEGIEIDLAVFPEKESRSIIANEWFKFWMFSQATIVHDPHGIARRNQDIAASYFRDNPRIRCAWERQQRAVERHKAERNHKLQFANWSEFARHIEEILAEPPAQGDGAKRAGP